MNPIQLGSWVRYQTGRGYGLGRVANIADGMATIATIYGHNINRRLSRLERTKPPANSPRPAPVEAIPE